MPAFVPSPGQPSPLALRLLTGIVRPLTRLLWRPTLEGLERLPPEGAFLLVANHSAGVGLAEILCLAGLLAEARERGSLTVPLAAFVHPINYRVPPMGWVQDQLGSIPSTYAAAEDALARGTPILVFPGGDHETLRPIWQAGRVDFGGRRGFLRIARAAGVPVAPMGIRGSHWTAPMLLRSRALAQILILPRLMGLKRWGVSLLGLLGALGLLAAPLPWAARIGLAWLWLASPLIFAPILPATIQIRIGAPIPPERLFRDDDPELDGALSEVQRAVQGLVDALGRR